MVASAHLMIVIVMVLISKSPLCKGSHIDNSFIGCLTVLKVFMNNEVVFIIQFMSSVDSEQ